MDIAIINSEINQEAVQTVNARDLHEFLESKQDFSTWVKNRIEQYGFVEDQDFTLHKFVERRATKIDYFISLDMAKELSMVERSDKGKEARQYFIECERKAREINADPVKVLSQAPKHELLLLASNLAKEVEELKPKAEALDLIATADGSYCITDAAKNLGMRPKDLFAWLESHKWIYKRPHSGNWLGYSTHCNNGDLEHKTTTVLKADGSEKITEQVRITAQGLTKLAKLIVNDVREAS